MLNPLLVTLFSCGVLVTTSLPLSAQHNCPTSLKVNSVVQHDWHYATDAIGSSVQTKSQLINDDHIWIQFSRVPRLNAKSNSWVELIYDLPNKSLAAVATIALEYKSSTGLVVKLSQQDYGGLGDKSYAHYQHKLAPADNWTTRCFTLDDFSRPSWTPVESIDVGMILEHINAIYLVPDLTDEHGGTATISVKSLTLLP
ncbi:hypothetical protein RC083_14845 [Pseudoalteromonas haloplanktis]|uniref:CBM11 domain-containing protein n=1 Tax=Pseudoalteromonas haloplanktis TaxID=228 RepID=A0ABU1BG13_PSEHA|nr:MULTISPECIES: hypothetical protein [Pseudoalteromonas]MDQ9092859.1 hypothetical protein [Pseudoalteromonas haloplanktis]